MSTFTNKIKQYKELAATTGGNLTIESGIFTPGTDLSVDDFTSYRVTGTQALASDLDVVINGALLSGVYIEILWEAIITPAGNNVTIFGTTVPEELVAKNFVAECRYNGTAWTVAILPDFSATSIVNADRIESDAVTTAKIANDAVTLAKMASGTVGSILAYNASGDIEEAPMATDGKLLIGVTAGKGYNTAVLSGDATISTSGVLTIANDAITTVKILDDNVTPAKLSASANKGQFAVQLEFDEAAKIGVIKYQICSTCTIDGIYATVNRVPATDTATVIPKNHGMVAMTGGQIDITTALALGNIVGVTPTANNTFTAGEQMTLETSKTTAEACTITVVVCYTVTA